jgi:hypothetical protein
MMMEKPWRSPRGVWRRLVWNSLEIGEEREGPVEGGAVHSASECADDRWIKTTDRTPNSDKKNSSCFQGIVFLFRNLAAEAKRSVAANDLPTSRPQFSA